MAAVLEPGVQQARPAAGVARSGVWFSVVRDGVGPECRHHRIREGRQGLLLRRTLLHPEMRNKNSRQPDYNRKAMPIKVRSPPDVYTS